MVLLMSAAIAATGPVPVTRIAPDYPEAANPMGIAGKVKAWLEVDAKGFVTSARVVSETPEGYGFGEAALAAARRWTFQPGKAGSFQITMNFAPSDGREALDLNALPQCPTPIERTQPIYPQKAENAGVTGIARIAVTIDPAGSVTDALIALEAPRAFGFGTAAQRAVRKWRFAPGAAGMYLVEVRFALSGGDVVQTGVHWQDLPKLPEPLHRTPIAHPQGGEVWIVVTLADDGSVINADAAKEEPAGSGLGAAVRNSLLLWRFEPGQAGVYRLNLRVDR